MDLFDFQLLYVLETTETSLEGTVSDKEKMLLASMKMIEMGIAPFTGNSFFCGEEISASLSSLSPEDRRKAKRKFRKMHKKAYRRLGIQGDHSTEPSTAEYRRRRVAVYKMVLAEISGEEIF